MILKGFPWPGLQPCLLLFLLKMAEGCQFFPPGEYLRFVRVSESLPVGDEVVLVEVHPRTDLFIRPVDKDNDVDFFVPRAVNSTHVSIKLRQSLEELVDSGQPRNVLKFRLVCDYREGDELIDAYLSVTVYVEDENDHAPEFEDEPYEVAIDELTPPGLTVFRGIQATDRDKPNTPNSEVSYSIRSGNTGDKFALEVGSRPALVLKRPLDFDRGDTRFELHLEATDGGSPPRTGTSILTVIVTDSDDLDPRFSRDLYRTKVYESYPITGRRLHKPLKFDSPIQAFDQDRAINASLRYDIVAGNEQGYFSIDVDTGAMFLEREIDLDSLSGDTFSLQIQASQRDNPLRTGLARVEVEVADMNDNQPQFEVELYNISIVENLPNGFSVLQVTAKDRDRGENAEFVYHLVDPAQAFSIDGRTGWLTVRNQAKLDRETRPSLAMRVLAREKIPSVTKQAVESFVNIEVTLLDANDNNPQFIPSNLYEFTVSNRAKVGHQVGRVEAKDPDLGRNGMILYEIKRGNKTDVQTQFSVDPQTGVVRVGESPLKVGRTSIFIEASDQPVNPSERRFSLAVVSVEVVSSDKVRMLPDFVGAPYEFWVGDDAPLGTSIGQVRINDALDRSRVLYDLLHSYHEGVPFAIEERSGVITVVDEIARYKNSKYDFESVVTDDDTTTLVTNVTIHVVDAQASNIHKPSPLEFRVRENVSGAVVGVIPSGPRPSYKARVKYSVSSEGGVFAVSQDGTLYTQRALDRELRDSYLVNVVAHTPRSDTHFQVRVIVEDANDNAPVFERAWYEGIIREDCTRCDVALAHRIRASDSDAGENAEFTLTLLGGDSDGFAITKGGGIVFKGRLDRETKDVYTMMVVARDRGNLSSQVRLTIRVADINDNSPKFTQLAVPTDIPDLKVTAGNSSLLQVVFGNRTLGRGKARHPALTMPESVAVGTVVGKLLATDKDAGENATVTYSLITETMLGKGTPSGRVLASSHFAIHPNTGELTVASRLPPHSAFLLNMSASDLAGLADHILIKVIVEDVNDHPPVFERPMYEFSVAEGTYKSFFVGKLVATDQDFDSNGMVSYQLLRKMGDNSSLPFAISENGDIVASGKLDREVIDQYSFRVMAEDQGPLGSRLQATVPVTIKILDTNDNPPLFYGYGRVVQITAEELAVLSTYPSKFTGSVALPVYFASITENNSPGTPVARIYANDSDSSKSGSGVVLYDLLRKKNHRQFFAIDKEGIVTATVSLDFESEPVHNVTVVASDLGTPSLSSTALLIVTVLDAPEKTDTADTIPLIATNYFELEVEENSIVPMELVRVNASQRRVMDARYTVEPTEWFYVDPDNGTLYLTKSPDREVNQMLTATITVRPAKRPRNMPTLVHPPRDLEADEVRVVVRVKDTNDNVPIFEGLLEKRPLVVAVPTSASYGYPVVKLHAIDADEGERGLVAYHLVTRGPNEAARFSVDPSSGLVSALASFAGDAGRLFAFDVRAVDMNGGPDGLYATANILVYVIDDHQRLILELGAAPYLIEPVVSNITSMLSNITGLEIKMRKLEPHLSSEQTDMYLYAVDPRVNEILDMDSLNEILLVKEEEIRRRLEPLPLVGIRIPRSHVSITAAGAQSGGLEVATIALGCIVILGALVSAFCVLCLHKRRTKSDSVSLGGTLFRGKRRPDDAPRSLFFPNAFHEDAGDGCRSHPSGGYTRRSTVSRHTSHCRHHRHRERMKASMASVHSSSGRDSGIVEPGMCQPAHCCPCDHSPPTSDTSSQGSYEDSLKSAPVGSDSGGCLHGRNGLNARQPTLRTRSQTQPGLTRTASQRLLVC